MMDATDIYLCGLAGLLGLVILLIILDARRRLTGRKAKNIHRPVNTIYPKR